MNREDIIRMAREAGFDVNFDIWSVSVDGVHINKQLARFATLVAAAERATIEQAPCNPAEDGVCEALECCKNSTDWEAIAADQAMTIALLRTELEDARTEAVALRATEQNLIAALEAEREAIAALRTAIEAAESQQPVAWMYDKAKYPPNDLRGQQWVPALWFLEPYTGNGMAKNVRPLYTTPPAPTPDPAFAEAEREACAKVCDIEASVNVVNAPEAYQEGRSMGAAACAAAIRARSNT